MTVTLEDGQRITVDPSLADVEQAVRRLDGSRWSVVSLRSDDHELVVGGAAATGLIVYADLGDGRFAQAVSPVTDSAGLVTVVAAGQPGEYEARLVTTADVAVRAAAEFVQSGRLAADVVWSRG